MTARGTRHLPVTSRYDDRRADSSGKRFLNWSVRDLGKKAKVHFNTVHAIERGKSHGKPETLAAIRKALEKAGVQFTNGKHPGVRLNGQR
jgi:ribosome-binding protein aMBF1 (putative translation factor)